ncbi:MAG: hypothetical protein Q9184_005602 [Pyrenodesmia sp. 2 TL-2023]
MHEVAIQEHPDIVQLLIGLKADINIKQTSRVAADMRKFHGSRPPLHWAAEKGHDLDNNTEINAKNCTDRTLFRKLLCTVVQALLSSSWTMALHGIVQTVGIPLDRSCDVEGQAFDKSISGHNLYEMATPLFLAANHGHETAVRTLPARGAGSRTRNTIGEMSIHVTSWRGLAPAVRILRNGGKDIEAKDTSYEETPLLKAASTRQTGVLRVLLDPGAGPDAVSGHGRNTLKHAPLYKMEGNEEAVWLLQAAYKRREQERTEQQASA